MANYETTIHFRIDGGGIFDLNVDLAVITIGALKDRLLTLELGMLGSAGLRTATLIKD